MGFNLKGINFGKGTGSSSAFKNKVKRDAKKYGGGRKKKLKTYSDNMPRQQQEAWNEFRDNGGTWSEFKKTPDYTHRYKRPANEPYGPEQSHHVTSAAVIPDSKKSNLMMSASEQQKIQRSIQKEGHFGGIDKSLLKGYEPGTPEYRRRIGEINAHHHYLLYADNHPGGPERAKEELHQRLAEMRPDNWEKRQSRFLGPHVDLYDEDGNYRFQDYEDMQAGKIEVDKDGYIIKDHRGGRGKDVFSGGSWQNIHESLG
mgnify:CR=1 FL=1